MTILERLCSGVCETEYCREIRRRAERNYLIPERQLLEILKTDRLYSSSALIGFEQLGKQRFAQQILERLRVYIDSARAYNYLA